MTYLELYMESLESRIAAGGTQEAVDKTFEEYNVFNPAAFVAWLSSLDEVECRACGEMFKPEAKTTDAEVTCAKCQSP